MSVIASMRNGLKFFLMSLGVSTPAKKPAPKTRPSLRPASNSPHTGSRPEKMKPAAADTDSNQKVSCGFPAHKVFHQ